MNRLWILIGFALGTAVGADMVIFPTEEISTAASNSIINWLNQTIGPPSKFGASSWFEAAYWIGGALAVIIAVIAIEQRTLQARATFLLHLYERWEGLEDQRKQVYETYRPMRNEVLRDHSDLEDKHRIAKLRSTCKNCVDEIKKDDEDKYHAFVAYLSFFETIGLFVRNGYVPLKDMLQLYKGPILEIDIMFRDHIEEWQKHANTPDGLFGNVLYLIKKTQRRERIREALFFWE